MIRDQVLTFPPPNLISEYALGSIFYRIIDMSGETNFRDYLSEKIWRKKSGK